MGEKRLKISDHYLGIIPALNHHERFKSCTMSRITVIPFHVSLLQFQSRSKNRFKHTHGYSKVVEAPAEVREKEKRV
jgi:hypothetical protein